MRNNIRHETTKELNWALLGYCKVANELLELLEVALIPTVRDSERDLPSRGMISHVVIEMESQV